MFEILLGIDESEERALAQAKAVAGMPGTDEIHATLLHDFTDNPTGASVGQIASVRRAKEYLEERSVDVSLRESSGRPAESIIETADELDADLICLAGRKRTPTGKVLFGSTTQAVILGSQRPVMVTSVED